MSKRLKCSAAARKRWGVLANNVQCSGCGKSFHRPKCELRIGKRYFCNIQCRIKASAGFCTCCNKPIKIRAGRSGSNRFCSKLCSSSFKRKQYIIKNGYALILTPNHPCADVYGYVREHRLVIERKLGRYLIKGEVVHHIDGNKLNNASENLQLFKSNSEHMKSHKLY